MRLYNTLSRSIEKFKPLNPSLVTLYTCGPTVYDYTHLGHMRKYTMDDVLKRTLIYPGYHVKHVMNITDVGHLTGDDDTGEDKLEKGAKKQQKTVWEVARFYTDFFSKTMKALNITPPDITCRATDHIPQMIKLIQTLEINGHTYQTKEAVYFDVTTFPNYGRLSKQKLTEKLSGVRAEVRVDPQKKHPADFALWFKSVGRFKDHSMHWESPWGDGFPGWHIECSAMSMAYLGESIDIHTGGVDHIGVHHENEIAQSESASGKPFVHYWVHHAFLNVKNEKMSKSKDNFFTIEDVQKKGIDPLSLRLLFMQTHYRQEMNFSWKAAKAANDAFRKLQDTRGGLAAEFKNLATEAPDQTSVPYKTSFQQALANDLQTPKAIATLWEMLKSPLDSAEKLKLLDDFDQVLGLKLKTTKETEIPKKVLQLAKDRQYAKNNNNFALADALRKEIESQGYKIEDTHGVYKIRKK